MCKILGGKLVISKRLPPCHGPLSLIYGCRRCSSPPDLDFAFLREPVYKARVLERAE